MTIIRATIEKKTLKNICLHKHVTNQYIIDKCHVSNSSLISWQDDNNEHDLPTIKQAKNLAKCLHIPFASLYLNDSNFLYKQLPSIKNMRQLHDAHSNDDSAINIAMIDLLNYRDFLLEGEKIVKFQTKIFSINIPDTNEVDDWVSCITKDLKFDLRIQLSKKSPRQLYLYIRKLVEDKGIMVCGFSEISIENLRGIAIYNDVYPIIGVNNNDSSTAKCFTIIHELVHLYKRNSSICNEIGTKISFDKEEIFCNEIAGNFLVPYDELSNLISRKGYSDINFKIVQSIAKCFSVSNDVIIRRLYDINVIGYTQYSNLCNQAEENLKMIKEINKGKPHMINIARKAFDNISPKIGEVLIEGYNQQLFTGYELSNDLSINQKYIDDYISEVEKCK